MLQDWIHLANSLGKHATARGQLGDAMLLAVQDVFCPSIKAVEGLTEFPLHLGNRSRHSIGRRLACGNLIGRNRHRSSQQNRHVDWPEE